MSGYSPEIEQAGITWGQLKKCRDDDYVCTMVSAFMLVQVTGQEGFPEPKLGQVLEELDDRFGIRLDGYAGQVHEARRMII